MSKSSQSPFLRTEIDFTQLKAPISSLSSEFTVLENCITNQHEMQQTRDKETTYLPINASSTKYLDRKDIQSHMSDSRIYEPKESDTPNKQESEGHQSSPLLLYPKDLNSLVSCVESM